MDSSVLTKDDMKTFFERHPELTPVRFSKEQMDTVMVLAQELVQSALNQYRTSLHQMEQQS